MNCDIDFQARTNPNKAPLSPVTESNEGARSRLGASSKPAALVRFCFNV